MDIKDEEILNARAFVDVMQTELRMIKLAEKVENKARKETRLQKSNLIQRRWKGWMGALNLLEWVRTLLALVWEERRRTLKFTEGKHELLLTEMCAVSDDLHSSIQRETVLSAQWKATNFSLSEALQREAELAGQCRQLDRKYARLRIWAIGILTQLHTAVERYTRLETDHFVLLRSMPSVLQRIGEMNQVFGSLMRLWEPDEFEHIATLVSPPHIAELRPIGEQLRDTAKGTDRSGAVCRVTVLAQGTWRVK
jgi:hypothetical protein